MKLISNLKQSVKLKRILYYAILLFLFAYVFSVPSFGESSSFTRYIIFVSMFFLGASAFAYCFLYEDFHINKSSLLVPAFCIFALIGTIAYSHEYRSWFSLVLLSLSFFIFVYAFKAIKNKYTIIIVVAVAFFLFSLYFIVHYRKQILDFRSYTNSSFRLGDFFDNPNGVSAYAVVGVSTPLYLVLFWDKKIKYVFIIPMLTMLLVGLTTGSRTFLLIVFLMVVVFLFFKFKKHKFIYLGVIAGIVIIGIILLNLPFLSTLKDRLIQAIQSIFGTASKVDTSTLERTVMIDYGFYLGSKRLFFGYGVDGFSLISGIGTYAHSNFAEVLCDFGLIGFLIFYSPLVILLTKSLMTKKIDKSFVITFVIYYLIVSFFNVIYYKKIYYLILAFMFYLVFVEPVKKTSKSLVPKLNRLVFVCDSMGSGGAEKVIASLSNSFVKKGINVTIVGVADLNVPHSFYELDNCIEYITLSNGSGKRIKALQRPFVLRKALKGLSPDVVISFLPNANIYTWLSLIGTKIPHIVSERNNPYLDPKKKIVRLLKTLSFIFADGRVFQTKDAMNYYSKVIQDGGTIIKNPIVLNTDKIVFAPIKKKIVLAVGSLKAQKNYKCLLDAFKIFNERMNGCYRLKIYGEGSLKNELIQYGSVNGIAQFVDFVGNDTEWHKKEQDDAMYVLSSDYEGMPNSLAEAMLLGIPSISTDCPTGGSRELIKDGINGLLVPVNDYAALADKMIEITKISPEKLYNETRTMLIDYSVEEISIQWINYIKGLTKEIYE